MALDTASDRAAMLADFGTTAIWSHGGTVATLTGIFDHPTRGYGGGAGGAVESLAENASLYCAAASLPTGAAAGDSVLIAGRSYAVRALMPDGTGMVLAEIEAVRG